jgi:hypothetical protein
MAEIIEYSFNIRPLTKRAINPWVTYRFYDEGTARGSRESMVKTLEYEVTDLDERNLKSPYVIIYPAHRAHTSVNTTGLVYAGEKIRHHATGSQYEDWYCREEDLEMVKEILKG